MSEVKVYDPREEKMNVITHAIGVACVPFALAGLLFYAKGMIQWFACILYILSMTAMFAGSFMYHAAANPARRALLRKFDHSSIYFLISGTYTPLMLLCIQGAKGYIILSLSWLITVIGVSFELFDVKPFKCFSLILYLVSGWLCITIMGTLIRNMSLTGLILLISGGVVYSAGVLFYMNRRIYSHAIWHLFVMGGVALHYLAVLSLLKH